jgi:hypothetical protein
MGLDSVELVMAVEEQFGITISDEEAQEMRTVGDMYQCVLGKVMTTEKSSCLTQKAFHLLRRTAMQLFSVPRDQFRPDTQLNLIIPKDSRRENWRTFQSAVGAANWPKLALSWAGALTLLALVFVLPWSMFVFGTAVLKWNALVAGTAALALMVLSIRAGKLVTRPFETEFRQVSTVRDLAYVLAAQNPRLFGTEHATWTADETWAVLASVIKVQTGVSQFTKDSRFVGDLKID